MGALRRSSSAILKPVGFSGADLRNWHTREHQQQRAKAQCITHELLADAEEAGHRVARGRERARERARTPRDDAAVERPVRIHGNAGAIARAERDRRRGVRERVEQGLHRRGRVLQVRVHDDERLSPRLLEPADDRAAQPLRVGARDEDDVVALGAQRGALLDGPVARVVVDDDDLRGPRGAQRGEDLCDERPHVLALVVRGDDDRRGDAAAVGHARAQARGRGGVVRRGPAAAEEQEQQPEHAHAREQGPAHRRPTRRAHRRKEGGEGRRGLVEVTRLSGESVE
jgi:hypothetical protein